MSKNKKCVYFTRHGQTFWNVEDKICGSTDIALTEYGQEQAIALGQKILEEGLQIDEILYSPLIRAADTARHISEITGIPAIEEPRLKEQNFGKYEGTSPPTRRSPAACWTSCPAWPMPTRARSRRWPSPPTLSPPITWTFWGI